MQKRQRDVRAEYETKAREQAVYCAARQAIHIHSRLPVRVA